jgi:hypothetical protein
LPSSANWDRTAFGNNTFIAFQANSTSAASSTDGITWTVRTLPLSIAAITFANNIFVAVVQNSTTAATSTNGITWTVRTLPTSNAWRASSFGSFSSPALNNLYKNATIYANSSEILEPGITLGAQNSIVVKGNSNLTFSAYGMEIS